MKIGLMVVARGATDPQRLVEHCRKATRQEVRWYVAAAAPGEQQRAAFARFVLEQPATLWLHPAPPGVGAARNEALLAAVADGCEIAILVDEAVAFAPDGLDRLILCALEQEAPGIVLSEPGGCVAIGPAAYHWVGAFDENIAGARLGMADYLLRAQAAAIPVQTCPGVTEGDGWAEDEGWSDKGWAAKAEQEYFAAKWGGPPGATTQLRPFGGTASRIEWARRAAPYGGHDLPRVVPEESELLVSRPVRQAAETLEMMPTGPAQQAMHRASVRAVYQSLLRRDPEDAAYDWHTRQLASGATTLAALCSVVRNSDEHRKILAREAEASPL